MDLNKEIGDMITHLESRKIIGESAETVEYIALKNKLLKTLQKATKINKKLLKNKTFKFGTETEQLEILAKSRNILFPEELFDFKNHLLYSQKDKLSSTFNSLVAWAKEKLELEVNFTVMSLSDKNYGLSIDFYFKNKDGKILFSYANRGMQVIENASILVFALALIDTSKLRRDNKILIAEINMIRYIKNCISNLRYVEFSCTGDIIEIKNFAMGDDHSFTKDSELKKLFPSLKISTVYHIPDELRRLAIKQ